ncbi:aspartic protease precursor [Aphelenchoides avenae]|nr:aspartic protease precursor [Aphelenchus avenae]KAH7704428.1 aspartic protease precursor [Aphelenchus avenae]
MRSTLLLMLALYGVASAGVFQVNLTRIQSRRSRMMAEGTYEEYRKLQEAHRVLAKTELAKGSGSQPVKDYSDAEYLGQITIG